jgi:hypothetical protein
MNRLSRAAAGAMAALALGVAMPAAAAYTVTYKGVITDGRDEAWVGGLGDLAGLPFSIVYTIEPATPGATFFQDGALSTIQGRYEASPVIGQFTIGSNAPVSIGHQEAYLAEYRDGYSTAFDLIYTIVREKNSQYDYDDDGNLLGSQGAESYAYTYLGSFKSDLSDGDVRTPTGAHVVRWYDYAYGYMEEYRAYRDALGRATNLRHTSAFLQIESINVTSAAPEPGAWALMILGFGLAGAALRRRAAGRVA